MHGAVTAPLPPPPPPRLRFHALHCRGAVSRLIGSGRGRLAERGGIVWRGWRGEVAGLGHGGVMLTPESGMIVKWSRESYSFQLSQAPA
jgi:hypothetical protein